MSKTKCDMCSTPAISRIKPFHTGRFDLKGTEIVVPDVHHFACEKCDIEWITNQEEERISRDVKDRTRHHLFPDQVSMIREAMGFNTKTSASDFLELNAKAFTKWEREYTAPNPAYDLLMRLAVFSKQNFEFIKALRAKDFEFDPNDYELICNSLNSAWNYQTMQLSNLAIGSSENSKLKSPGLTMSHVFSNPRSYPAQSNAINLESQYITDADAA